MRTTDCARFSFLLILIGFSTGFIISPAESSSADDIRMIAILENERSLQKEPDIHLSRFFHHENAHVRARSLLAAGRIGDPRILPGVIQAIGDRDPVVRRNVAFALGQIGSKEGLSAVAQLLKDSDREVRRLSLEAAGRIGGMEITHFIVPFLEDPDVSLRVQAALALALLKDRSPVEILIRKAQGNDPAQWGYVYALYRIADERAVPVLHSVLEHPVDSPDTGDPSSLLFALKALWSMKKPLSNSETEMLLRHRDARVVANTLDVISVSSDSAMCPLVQSAMPAMKPVIQKKAIETAGIIGCSEIWKQFEKDTNPNLRGSALQSMAKNISDASLATMEQAILDSSWIVRWYVAQGMANLKPESAIPILKKLAADRDSSVRLAALESLSEFAPENADVLLPFLNDADFAVRAIAADTLGKTKNPKYLPALIRAYHESSAPEQIEARLAILDTMVEFHSSEVLDLYISALLDSEYMVRRHAIDAVRKAIGPKLYLNGDVKDLDDFLFPDGKVSSARMAQYPADYGFASPETEVDMVLDKGTVRIRLLSEEAPVSSENFATLARNGFYDGLRIHRVVPNFVIQGGDPRGDGWGTGEEVLKDQFGTRPFSRGVVGMPTAGKDSGGCQFFITHSRQPHLDGNYTIFGEVISGMEFVDSTEIGDKIRKVSVSSSPE